MEITSAVSDMKEIGMPLIILSACGMTAEVINNYFGDKTRNQGDINLINYNFGISLPYEFVNVDAYLAFLLISKSH